MPRYTFTTSSTSCSTQASARSLANTDHTQGGHEPIDSNGSGRPGTSTCTQPETVMRARSHARHGHCCSLCTRDAERRPICVVCWTCCSSACRYDDAIFAVTSALPARRSLHTFARTDGPSAGCRLFTSTCLGQNDRFSQTSESSTRGCKRDFWTRSHAHDTHTHVCTRVRETRCAHARHTNTTTTRTNYIFPHSLRPHSSDATIWH